MKSVHTYGYSIRRPRMAVSSQQTAAIRDLRSADCEVQALMLLGWENNIEKT